MSGFIVKDVAGHTFRVSTDPRHPPAMDALPPGLSRRRPGARDQEEGESDAPLTPEEGASIVTGLLAAFEGSDRDEFARHICDIAQSISNGNGSDAAAFSVSKPAVRAQDRRRRANDGTGDYSSFTPAQPPHNRGSGFARPGGALDRRLAADAGLAQRDPALWGMMSRIRLGGR